MLRKTTTALALAGALMLVAGGCGDNDDTAGAGSENEEATPAAADAADNSGEAAGGADFCQSAKALYDQLAAAGPSGPTSPEGEEVFAEAQALEAPEAIAEDWNAILDTLVAPVVTGEIDTNDPAGATELTNRAANLADSLQRTGAYFDTECGFASGGATTTTAAPAPDAAASSDTTGPGGPTTTAAPEAAPPG